MSSKEVVLAFSGGLDTSFCVPYLSEQGWRVTTAFVDTGGVSAEEVAAIEERAMALGAHAHHTLDASDALWKQVVVPLVQAGAWYRDRYPGLCSDRYVIVEACLALAKDIGAKAIAHGCTAMGNDQVRFDLTASALSDLPLLAPIRELQQEGRPVREIELDYLTQRGIAIPPKSTRWTINENLLGVTISGGEIDDFAEPPADAWQWTRERAQWPATDWHCRVRFQSGEALALDGEEMPGPALLAKLNHQLAQYGVGRYLYTGDTTIGLKGRIAFEAPGLTGLAAAHKALEEITLSSRQSAFKPQISREWMKLVYEGFFFEPLKQDLEACLSQCQQPVSGEVTLRSDGGSVLAVAVNADYPVLSHDAVYAQSAGWSAADAQGFIKLLGQDTVNTLRARGKGTVGKKPS